MAMNVFEDLIDELKEDNLLEESIIDFPAYSPAERYRAEVVKSDFDVKNSVYESADLSADKEHQVSGDKKKFLSEEIAALQVVEHVFTGVERDYLNIKPNSYNELAAKQALHRFVHSSAPPESEEVSDLESCLNAEIKNWKDSLLTRDAAMSPAHIRVYCETSQPPLSSQALFALARFYYGACTDPSAATKLDSVLTRLFSKRDKGELRGALLNKEETVSHLRARFSAWTGLSSPEELEDDPESMLPVLSFEDFSLEAESALGFDNLIRSDFFTRLAQLKESIHEQFKSPLVMAACIRCNISVSNAVVEYLKKLGPKTNPARLNKKLGNLRAESISLAVGRTIDFDRVFADAEDVSTPVDEPASKPKTKVKTHPSTPAPAKQPTSSLRRSSLLAVNKWLLLTTIIVVLLSAGLYAWTAYSGLEQPATTDVTTVQMDGFEYKDTIKTAKISDDTMYALMTSAWDSLDNDSKQNFVKKLYEFASKNGAKNLNIRNSKGKTVAVATPDHQELVSQ